MTNLSLINQMLSELVICFKGVFCRGRVRTEEGGPPQEEKEGKKFGINHLMVK